MAERPHQNLSDKMLSAVNVLKDVGGGEIFNMTRIKNAKQFSQEFDEMLAALHLQLSNNSGEIDDITNSHQRVANGWTTKKDHLLQSHNQAMRAYDLIKDQENIIARIESRGHLYALFFRILTTLGIGMAVMGIYGLADIWGVDMPLMRASASGLMN